MKLMLFITGLITVLSSASCSKSYTCECNSSWSGGKVDVAIKARNDKAAKLECYNLYKDFNDAPTDCRLK